MKLKSNEHVFGEVRHFLAPGDHSIRKRWVGGQGLVVVAQQPEQVFGPDANGVKTVIDYRVKEDGSKVRRPPHTRPRVPCFQP